MESSKFDLETFMTQYVNLRGEDILKVSDLRVGWEAWAQIEIARFCALKKQLFQREFLAYGNEKSRLRADFIFIGKSEDLRATMELKCASYGEAPAHFAKRMSQDVYKLCNNLKEMLKGAPAWVIGICPLTHRQGPTPGKITAALNISYGKLREEKQGIDMAYGEFVREVTTGRIGVWWWHYTPKLEDQGLVDEGEVQKKVDTWIAEDTVQDPDIPRIENDPF